MPALGENFSLCFWYQPYTLRQKTVIASISREADIDYFVIGNNCIRIKDSNFKRILQEKYKSIDIVNRFRPSEGKSAKSNILDNIFA